MRTRRVGPWLRFCVLLTRPLLLMLIKPRWSGLENVPADGPVIFAVNHLSHADPITVSHVLFDLPRYPRFLAKESLFRVKGLGALLRGTGQIPVYRGTKDASASLRAAHEVLAAGGCVVIYPEGTTTSDPQWWPGPAKTGVARLALETGAPVIPLAQWGSQRLYDSTTHRLHLRWREPVTTLAGPAVDLAEFSGRPLSVEVLRGATAAIMDPIRTQLGTIRGETPPERAPATEAREH